MQWIVNGFAAGAFGVIASENGAPSWSIMAGCVIGLACFAVYFWRATAANRNGPHQPGKGNAPSSTTLI